MLLYNTLTRKKEILKPLKGKTVKFYACGPTVYNRAHIGNLRTYLWEDILIRTLEYLGFSVRQAMNITDVGHLTSDEDTGEDKLEVGAKREGISPLAVARKYEKKFFEDLKKLNIKKPSKIARATETVKDQIAIIKVLEKKGLTYRSRQAVYFNTSKLKNYGKLSPQKSSQKITGARQEVVIDKEKKNPQDFVLWFFLEGKYKNHILRWPSPWGEGFPGWHIECSAISRKLLGQPFDIHCGGREHIPVHHTNEIAQSEAAFGTPLAKIWLHGEFLVVEGEKMSKSKNNFFILDDLGEKGFGPMDFRYLSLLGHYQSPLNFTWKGIEAAKNALSGIKQILKSVEVYPLKIKGIQDIKKYKEKFSQAIGDNLNTPQALAVLWEAIRDEKIGLKDKKRLILDFDKVLGLNLKKETAASLPQKIRKIAIRREGVRRNKQFIQADVLRKEIEALGYKVDDTALGPIILKQ
ncbi:MAG: Cysteine-tRNA ligase [Parcubacteria group bacterium GW2011_GWB1_43_8b]|nr:MAG: Cysteine-tRNA ligase [Parcubacteria group bacterium GW2011_GWB1_43_8b]